MERYFMQMETKNKNGVAILLSDKIDFKTKASVRVGISRDKEGHFIMIE